MRGRGAHRYFVLDTATSAIEFVEPETYRRKLGLLGDWEEIVADAAERTTRASPIAAACSGSDRGPPRWW